MKLETVGSPGLWVGFVTLVLVLVALDLGLFHRKARALTLRQAATSSAVWVGLALAFNVFVFARFGGQKALEFAAGYLVEEALSVDNLFVFIVIFRYFRVPPHLQHRVLFWGILGALVMRATFILLGGAFLQRFHWAIYVFGAILVYTGIKLLRSKEEEAHPEKNPVVRLSQRFIPVTDDFRDQKLLVFEKGRRRATPLLVTLLTIEATDVVFAVDSIPAVFGVTQDPFIVFSSNIFAVLGLRSLYFMLASVMDKFRYLKVGLAFVLLFVGGKMLLANVWKVPIGASLAVIAGLLGGSVLASWLVKPRDGDAPPP